MSYYPPVGFHFRVDFFLPSLTANDIMFREVNGLSVTVETETYVEGGQNHFIHTLPVRTKYANLELKRGLLLDSGIAKWVMDSLEHFEFQPANLLITLLNENHQPRATWNVVNAIPIEWSIDSLNAEDNKIVVESMSLVYQSFKLKKES